MNQPLLFKQLQTSGGWNYVCACARPAACSKHVFPEILLLLFCIFLSPPRVWSVFLSPFCESGIGQHANDENVSGKVVQKQRIII